MAKKNTASGGMNRTERVAGTIFFLVYLLVMPLLATRIFDLLEVVLDTTIPLLPCAHVLALSRQLEPRAFNDAAGTSRLLRRE